MRIRTDRGVSNIPYPKHPSLPKGEDRVGLISTEDISLQGGIVVDGVGGSSNFALGVDSGTFAEELMEQCVQISSNLEQCTNQSKSARSSSMPDQSKALGL